MPATQEKIITEIFNTIALSKFDASGMNKMWLTDITIDERSIIIKFFRDSGP